MPAVAATRNTLPGPAPLSAAALARTFSSGNFARPLAKPPAATWRGQAEVVTGIGLPAPTSCGDDPDDFTTLRHAVLSANSGDTIDVSSLQCSKITLQHGAIAVAVDDLTIRGAGVAALTIDGNASDRVFEHTGKGTLTLTGMTVANGATRADNAYGGCILSAGSVTLEDAALRSCQALGQTLAAGGGAAVLGSLKVHSSTLADNVADAAVGGGKSVTSALAGGAVTLQQDSQLELLNSRVTGNVAHAASGLSTVGGVEGAHVTAKYSTFSGNEAIALGDYYNYSAAGGLAATYSLRMQNCTIDHNAADFAGGMFVIGAGLTTIAQSTISSNTGRLSVGGMYASGSLELANSTIAFNSAGLRGGGLSFSGGGTMTLDSTIVADNVPFDLTATSDSALAGSNNLIKVLDTGVTVPVGTLRLDPLLKPLAYNGGPTRTHALDIDSPAIDTGSNVLNRGTDQRGPGYPRVIGTAADIGAFEYDFDHIFGNAFESF